MNIYLYHFLHERRWIVITLVHTKFKSDGKKLLIQIVCTLSIKIFPFLKFAFLLVWSHTR